MTRADFYVGIGVTAKYLGSIFNEGGSVPNSIKRARTPEKFEKYVAKYIKKMNGSTTWSFEWEDSKSADYSYWLKDEKLYVLKFGVGAAIIEKKRGRPAAFERTWAMPKYVVVSEHNPHGNSIEDVLSVVTNVTPIPDCNVLLTPDGTTYTSEVDSVFTDPAIKLTTCTKEINND